MSLKNCRIVCPPIWSAEEFVDWPRLDKASAAPLLTAGGPGSTGASALAVMLGSASSVLATSTGLVVVVGEQRNAGLPARRGGGGENLVDLIRHLLRQLVQSPGLCAVSLERGKHSVANRQQAPQRAVR